MQESHNKPHAANPAIALQNNHERQCAGLLMRNAAVHETLMEPFEISSIFPLDITPVEQELGFTLTAISLTGFGPGDEETTIRLVARRLSASDIAIKMTHDGKVRYRLMRHGTGGRIFKKKPRWHPLTSALSDHPTVEASGIVSSIVPVPYDV